MYRRPVAAATALAADASDPYRFLDKRVVVTGDSFLLTPNGRACLSYATRLIAKICRNVSISLPGSAGEQTREARALAGEGRDWRSHFGRRICPGPVGL